MYAILNHTCSKAVNASGPTQHVRYNIRKNQTRVMSSAGRVSARGIPGAAQGRRSGPARRALGEVVGDDRNVACRLIANVSILVRSRGIKSQRVTRDKREGFEADVDL